MPRSTQRDEYWPEVEQFFDGLAPSLYPLGLLLKNNLAILYSGSGQFKDILTRSQDYPALDLHLWLLDDLGMAEDEARRELERRLLVGMALAFAAGYARDCLLDANSPFDNRLVFLEQALVQASTLQFARLFPEDSPFWPVYRACWRDYAQASLAETCRQAEPLAGVGLKLAPARLPAAAVALKAGRAELLPQLLVMIDGLNRIFEVQRAILAFRYDLKRGHYSYPILRTLQAAGLDPQHPVSPERALGALVLTGAGRELCQESLAELAACRRLAAELGLANFGAYLDTVEGPVRSLLDLLSLTLSPAAQPIEPAEPVAFIPYREPLPQALAMTEGYLLSDLTFRESWDVQRGGVFDRPEITARAFPSGLIVEVLCEHGHHLPQQIDQIFAELQANGFQYYDYLPAALPDADDLGLLLRLARYSDRPAAHREILNTPLAWLARSLPPSGQVPVWFSPDRPGEEAGRPVLIWGHSCTTTEANLLLGLIDYDWDGYRAIIEPAALSLFERILSRGLSASLYYLPPFSLWVTLKLIAALEDKAGSPALRHKSEQVTSLLLDRLALEAARPWLSPQEAALLTLACFAHPAARPLFRPGWLTILLKSQRHDGSWDGEPLFLIPDRNLTAWYSSRPVTTAYCYHALKTYQAGSGD